MFFIKCINISCLGARCVSSWRRYGLKKGINWPFFVSLCLYITDTIKICIKYRLIPQKYNKNNNNMEYGGGYLWVWGVWVGGVRM